MGDFKFPARRAFGASKTGHLFSEQRTHVLFWRIFFPEKLRQVAAAAMLVVEFSSHSPGVGVVRLVDQEQLGWWGGT
jgi:hypothetical protein